MQETVQKCHKAVSQLDTKLGKTISNISITYACFTALNNDECFFPRSDADKEVTIGMIFSHSFSNYPTGITTKLLPVLIKDD